MFIEYKLYANDKTKCWIYIFWFYIHINPVIISISAGEDTEVWSDWSHNLAKRIEIQVFLAVASVVI